MGRETRRSETTRVAGSVRSCRALRVSRVGSPGPAPRRVSVPGPVGVGAGT